MAPAVDLVVAALILLLAAGVQGFLGFGFGIIAMSGLTVSHDLLHAAGVVNLTGMVLTGSVLWQLRAHTLWRHTARLAPWIVLGVIGGVAAVQQLDRTWMVRSLAITVVAISAWNLLAPALRAPRSRVIDAVVGIISGVFGGAFNTGGPPLVAHLYAQDEPPEALKATIQALFLTISLSRVPVAAAQGLMGPTVWRDAALGAPFVVAGLLLGIAVGRRVSPEHFRRAAWVGLLALGLALLVAG